ncbi:hypothetical protein PAXRUDRAFT_251978 [Paxillus rubicundulus Ve08.2h10]|uniref:BZIP domain-containing protein n=1 Tax=Paxillus rubicundulus Ve08.2h10 TaxID=930991 RepID=A0A0D0DNB0_9AGAM|nr:hypothetical protein PAXRUDRAFT_251978 [Paxillus rubicundulus Ve08.2h10]
MPEDSTRSLSRDADLESDNDIESHADQDTQSQAPNKPGRKKNPNSQAARRDQNRIAQREFRLRKQQRIRDLEARVELLSGSQDEALTDLRAILKDLMAENLTLRNLLKSVAGFIGEGTGGMISSLGFDMHEWNIFLNKAETDTAWESFQSRKHSQKTSQTSSAMSSILGSQTAIAKRPSEDDIGSSRAKKSRTSNGDASTERQDSYPLLMPMGTTVPPPPAPSSLYPSAARSSPENMFSDMLRNGHASSPVFMPPTPSDTPGHYPTSSTSSSYPTYIPPMGIGVDQGMNPLPYTAKGGTVTSQRRVLSGPQSEEPEDEESLLELREPKKTEAFKLIKYHLENYMRNSAYCLPSSLRPTLVQRTINHESVIDRIVHPELRDRIILLRGQFSLADCLFDYKKAIKLHGDDVLAHSNWELAEWWLRKYSYLIEKATLNTCNRWRRERGETELTVADIGAQGGSPAS